jgi:fumarate hydratase class II
LGPQAQRLIWLTMPTRTESDSLGPVEVPADALWGAQTARSLHFFAIGQERMPLEIIHALAWVKGAAAEVNAELGLLDAIRAGAIAEAAQAVARGDFDAEFPLSVWQTGSGTQSHMNVNEVLATLATRALAGAASSGKPVHPNDDVNLGQSSNDVFPTAMHVATLLGVERQLLPALMSLHEALLAKAVAWKDVIKIGRTHGQDATPVTLGQEFGGYAAQLALCRQSLWQAREAVCSLAIGGTAVGTGLLTHPEFGARVAAKLASQLGVPLVRAENLFAALAGHEALVALHGAMKMLAVALYKIASDIRLLGSGPRAGLGELRLPRNEPGSSMMPGKVNPTQVEALTMVCAQVMGNDVTVGFAASQGSLELNVYKPVIALNVLQSTRLLADAMRSFCQHCIAGLEVDAVRMQAHVQNSLMLVTALVPHLGYDAAARIAGQAQASGSSLREAALASGSVSEAQFAEWVNPENMLGPTTSE